MGAPVFPTSPPRDLAELYRLVLEWSQDIGPFAGAKLIRNQTVGTAETPIAHGIVGGIPSAVFFMPYALATVARTRAPDKSLVYLTASVAVQVDLLVVP